MTRAGKDSHSYRFSSAVLLISLMLATGCKSKEKAPFVPTGSGNGTAGSGAVGGSGSSNKADAGASAGKGGSGGGSGAAGKADAGPIQLPTSPSAPWIAYVQIDASGFGQLFFVKADGTGMKEFSGTGFSETDPAWSPDSSKLAYTEASLSVGPSLHVLDFKAGTNTVVTDKFASFSRPRWSPDGQTIVVAGSMTSGGTPALFRVNAADGTASQITMAANGDGGHDFAPDGTLYFVRKVDMTTFDIFSVAYTGSPADQPTRITTGSKVIGGVAVHPDGAHLLFARSSGTTTELVEHTLSGGADRVLGSKGDEQAAYFRGGDKLVLNRDMSGSSSEIDVTDKGGTLVKHCTTDVHFNTSPAVSSVENSAVDLSKF